MRKVLFTKTNPRIVEKNRKYYQQYVRKQFIKYCAYKGLFDDLFSKREIENCKKGHLPNGYNVHHNVPLSFCPDDNGNTFANLTVMPKKKHAEIHDKILYPQLIEMNDAPVGATCVVEVPILPMVDREGILEKKQHFFRNKQNQGR